MTDIPAAIDAIDDLTPAADRIAYYTGASTAALTPLTAFGRSLIDDADAAAGRTTLGAQRAVQFQNGGVNLGSAGTAATVNFTGNGVTASRSGDTITVNVTGGGGGAATFLDLGDTPGSYANAAGNYVRVNSTPNGLEFRTAAEVLADIGAAAAGHTHTVSDVSGAVPNTRTISTTNGLTGGGNLVADRTLSLTGQALALHNLTGTGLMVRTGTDTFAVRSLSAGSNISITNSDGVSGNPTIAVTGLAAVATSGSASDLTTGSLNLARLAQGGASTDQVLAWSGSAWAPANAVPTWTGANTALVRNNADNGYEARARKSSVSVFLPADGNVGQADPGGQLFIWPNVPTTLSAVRARTLGGTCNIQVFRNGTAINGFSSAVALTTSVTSTTSTEAFSQDDRVSVAITGASSLTGVFITFIGVETGP